MWDLAYMGLIAPSVLIRREPMECLTYLHYVYDIRVRFREVEDKH